MEKSLIFFLLFSVNTVFAQLTYVPDDNFEQALIDLGYDDILDDYVLTANINTITSLDVDGKNISDLTGIEDFTSIIELDCDSNNLVYLNVSQNLALSYLFCYDNLLTDIDVSQNSALSVLNCNFNQLNTLDVSQNTSLVTLYCYKNHLTYLNVSQNTILEVLGCDENQLNTLNVSQNTSLNYLSCAVNQLIALDISQNMALTTLYSYDNLLTTLDVSQNKSLNLLSCFENQLTTLDVSQNVALTILACNSNQLTTLDTLQNTALTSLTCSDNHLTTLDVSQHPDLGRLQCNDNQLIYLDIRNGNNSNIPNYLYDSENNPNLTCIFVDDANWSIANWTNIDPNSTFVETQAGCDALTIEEIEFNELIEVFPNPTNNLINIRLSNEIEMNEAVLHNYLGNAIIKTNKNFMDVSNLETGIYMLRIITKDDRILSKRIIIENE